MNCTTNERIAYVMHNLSSLAHDSVMMKLENHSRQALCEDVCWLISEIPAKKWGDTEIAEQGRSVLVMRARYRSAGLIPHQRGWTDAG